MKNLKHYRMKELTSLLGLSKQTLYSYIRAGTFPRPIVVSRKLVLFSEAEILHWIEQRADRRAQGDVR